MGHNVFVSYKYKDTNVRPLPNITPYTWGRDYVDVLEKLLPDNGHVYCGEQGEDDLSGKSDDYIYSHLKNMIWPTWKFRRKVTPLRSYESDPLFRWKVTP